MPRPHEDRERHTLTDHRPGGETIAFEAGSWFAVEIARVKRERLGAALSAYESMIERARTSSGEARCAAVFSAATGREVLALVGVAGHEEFRQLASAWDDHHRFANGHAVTESRTLGLYRVERTAGDVSIDPASTDAYVFERMARDRNVPVPIVTDVSAALGFRGVVAFRSDDGNRSILIYRFENLGQFELLRIAPAPHTEHMRPVKTFS
jgi:hypothetical protein